jgi:hypothetical protein
MDTIKDTRKTSIYFTSWSTQLQFDDRGRYMCTCNIAALVRLFLVAAHTA